MCRPFIDVPVADDYAPFGDDAAGSTGLFIGELRKSKAVNDEQSGADRFCKLLAV